MSSRGLGKGIESILPVSFNVGNLVEGIEVVSVPLEAVTPSPDQPRKSFDEVSLNELAESIKQHGILQPLILVMDSPGKYTIIAGERRFRAAGIAGLKKVPAVIKSLSDVSKVEIALVENVQREDLNPIEQAESIRRLNDDFGQTYEEIAKKLGKAYASVANLARLLKLPEDMKASLVEGKIKEGHARTLLALIDYPDQQAELHRSIVKHGWSVRRAEQYAKQVKLTAGKRPKDADRRTTIIENEWTKKQSESLGYQVSIQPLSGGGYVRLKYADERQLDDLKSLIDRLK